MYSLNSLQIPINSRSDSIHSYSLELFPFPLPLETDKLRFFGRIREKEVERGRGGAIARRGILLFSWPSGVATRAASWSRVRLSFLRYFNHRIVFEARRPPSLLPPRPTSIREHPLSSNFRGRPLGPAACFAASFVKVRSGVPGNKKWSEPRRAL